MIIEQQGSRLYQAYLGVSPKRFTCPMCSCIFVMTAKEYGLDETLRATNVICPFCHNKNVAEMDVSFDDYIRLFGRENGNDQAD